VEKSHTSPLGRSSLKGINMEIIGRKVHYQQGTYAYVQFWVRGWRYNIPHGIFIFGWSGKETTYFRDIITPIGGVK
jgi:hypothetical protein